MRAILLFTCAIAAAPLSAGAQGAPRAGLTAFEQERTGRLLNDRLACMGCHRLGAVGGAIGPTFDGLAERVDEAYVLRMIRDPSSVLPGTLMPRQPMPEREARRLATYLMSTQAASTPPAAPMQAPPALPADGELNGASLYARHCASCHGTSGAGDGWNASNLPVVPTRHSDARVMSERADDTLYDGIAGGGFVLDKSNLMPAFAELLEPTQIRALVAHIRTLCGCAGPPWSRRPQW
jgi:mono/diheme cytochrome c family protein